MSWIAGWNKRIKLTISGSCIDGDLDNFPIMVHLDSTCSGVFNELGSNSKRISVVNSEQSPCYVEVERWDETTKNAWLWVKIPTLISGIDSDLYLYYDNLRPDNSAYVGTVGETSAQNVWDSNFVGVWHMNQNPTGGPDCIKDSTVSGSHGTPGGAMISDDLVDGKIGKALDFDNTDDYVETSDLFYSNLFTLEAIINPLADGIRDGIIVKRNSSGGTSGVNEWGLLTDDSKLYLQGWDSVGAVVFNAVSSYGSIVSGTNTYVAGVATGKDNDCFLMVNNAKNGTYTQLNDIRDTTSVVQFGARTSNNDDRWFNGIIDEVRISIVSRSEPWLKATYYSNWNQLLNYGNEEVVSSGILPGWNNRLKLTIQNDHIDNTLTDFPVMIKLSNSSGFNSYDNRGVFYELEANINRKKIAITDSTGVAQCFVEIERFSCEETEAVLWTKLPIIYDSVGTHFYLYYDKTKADNVSFVGDVNSIVAQNVWDENFVGVWHMSQNPTGGSGCIKDSTGNNNDGTPVGSMAAGDLVDGKVGKALNFDGINDSISLGSNINQLNSWNIEATVKRIGTVSGTVVSQDVAGWHNDLLFGVDPESTFTTDNRWAIVMQNAADTTRYILEDTQDTLTSYQYIVADYDASVMRLYVDSQLVDDLTKTGLYISDQSYYLGTSGQSIRCFNGIIDETRISNIARSVTWIKATYHSNWDSLIVYETEDITASWLDDWAHRIKLTIDHTKIDSSLVNFPVLITLTSGGQSDFFSGLACSVDDVFTGNDGSVPTTILWTGNSKILNNKLYLDSSGSYGGIVSKYELSGDFDIQIDFSDITFPATNSWGLAFHVKGEDGTRYNIRIEYSSSSLRYHSYRDGTQGYLADAVVGTSDTSGKFKITRENNTFKGYQWSGAAWVQNGTGLTINGLGNVEIGFSIGAWDTSPFVAGNFDNFKVNSGTAIWPNSTHPYRKKIALTKNNGITQCPVEIEHWDFYNGKINLWTKIPTIVCCDDTDFYLYYDKTKDNNGNYIGDVGSTPAQNVWDDNFVGVWHMNQDPSTGGACIKDSTVSGSHGTVSGTMTSGDLVDGKIGKALDFDGNDDFIDLGTGSEDDPSCLTVSIISKITVPGALFAHRAEATRLIQIYAQSASELKLQMRGSGNSLQTISKTGLDLTNFFFVSSVFDKNSNNHKLYVNDLAVETLNYDFGAETFTSSKDLLGCYYEGSAYVGHVTGILDQVSISNVVRSASWVKATYYSSWDTLLTYGNAQNKPDYYYHGYVKEKGVYVARKLYLYSRDTGALMDSCMSNGSTGYYLLETSASGEHFVVALDNDAGDDYNALVQDRIYPNGS